MQFLFPTFLFALSALAIPVIIHLFYFRRFKKVYFTNVRFLREVKEETSARSKLRNLLVLLARMLALAALVFAFAQPFIPTASEVVAGNKAVSVFIDNSFSMSSLSQDVPLLEKAKQRGREIIQAYSATDRFQVLTNDFEGRHQRLVSQEDALALIDEIKVTPSVRTLSSVIGRQEQTFSFGQEEAQVSYLVSDFQKNITDIANWADTVPDVHAVPLQSVQERNISIDTAWFEAPVQLIGQTNQLIVRMRNYSNQDAENIRLAIRYEGQTKPAGTLTIPAGATATDTVNVTVLRNGWHDVELSVTDYPVQFDDKYFCSFYVAEEVKVLVINEESTNRYLDAAFAGIPYFTSVNASSRSLEFSTFSSYQLIILHELKEISTGLSAELHRYALAGGNVLVFPSRNAGVASYNGLLQNFGASPLLSFEETTRNVGGINTDEFVFRDVFEGKRTDMRLPVSKGNFRLERSGKRMEEVLLNYRDGSAFLSKYQAEQGHLYFCAAPLGEAYSDLTRSGEIFVPLLYKTAISSARNRQIAYTIGQTELIETDHQATGTQLVYKLKGPSGEFIPEQRIVGSRLFLTLSNQIEEAGFYDLFTQEAEVLSRFAFNFDRKESDLNCYTAEELQAVAGPNVKVVAVNDEAVLTAEIEERSQGISLWRWFIVAALVFLAVEVLLLRFWKV
jgi:hypothetical protein